MPARSSTTDALPRLSATAARRLLMHAQGLLDNPKRRATPGALRSLIRRMGYVQVDSINMVDRAHHLTLASRLDGYRHEHLARLHERDRTLFEHWTHDASLLPIEFFAHWHHRRKRFIQRKDDRMQRWLHSRLGDGAEGVLDDVLSRIEREGPVQSRDFEDTKGDAGPWWGWKPAKAALEYLWWRGDLSVAARVNFQKVYDLTRRIYPDHHDLDPPEEGAFVDFCCREALARSGVATTRELVDFFGAVTIAEVNAWRRNAEATGEIVEVMLESVDGSKPRPAAAVPDWKKRALAAGRALEPLEGRVRLLSPFDPVLRNRERAKRVFGFDYTFEAFVPAARRTYGYYVLPILRGERLVGRADAKFHRDRATLTFNGVWWELGMRQSAVLKRGFDEAATRLAGFIGAEKVTVKKTRFAAK